MRKTDNLESYRIFCAVAACGGVKEAGIELSMEPSNIFRLLRQLEEDLAVPLFIRQSHPIRLTEQGRLFFDHAQHILREQALMLEAIRDNLESDAGLIQIASTAGVRYQTLTPALVQYQNRHPEVTFELRDMVQGARNFFVAPDGSANDIVVTFLSEDPVPEDVHVEKLFDIPFVACASPSTSPASARRKRPRTAFITKGFYCGSRADTPSSTSPTTAVTRNLSGSRARSTTVSWTPSKRSS